MGRTVVVTKIAETIRLNVVSREMLLFRSGRTLVCHEGEGLIEEDVEQFPDVKVRNLVRSSAADRPATTSWRELAENVELA